MDKTTGEFYWNELMTRDLAKAKAFYAAVCGWSYEAMEVDGMTYTLIMVGEKPAGGLFEIGGPEHEGMPEMWMGYVAVDDADAACAAAEKSGGTVIRPPFEVTGVGRIAIIKDGGAAAFGVIKPAPMPND